MDRESRPKYSLLLLYNIRGYWNNVMDSSSCYTHLLWLLTKILCSLGENTFWEFYYITFWYPEISTKNIISRLFPHYLFYIIICLRLYPRWGRQKVSLVVIITLRSKWTKPLVTFFFNLSVCNKCVIHIIGSDHDI